MSTLKNQTLLVIASTYPRWPADKVPGFVEQFVLRISGHFKRTAVIVPHYAGAVRKEHPIENISVTRFRYAYPYGLENIAYGEFKKTAGYPVKTLLYVISEFWTTLLIGFKNRPVVLNPHWLIPQGFVAIVLKPILGCRVVVTVHGADIFTLNGRFMHTVKRFVLRHADAVVVNSSATQAACDQLVPRDYLVAPMGIDLGRFKTPSRAKHDRSTFELIFVGRLVEQKGIMILCEAIRLLSKKNSAPHLTVVGDGELRGAIEAYTAKNELQKFITLAGWVQPDKITEFYARADVFVGPSTNIETGWKGWKEAFGTVFAEASAMGLPVVATNTGGISDVVKDGETGLLVPQKDPAALADAIARLQKDSKLRQKMGEAGARYIARNYSWESTIKKYLTVLEQ